MRVAVDAHMVGQPTPGDAGNARYAAQLVEALCATAGGADQVAALIAYADARRLLPDAAIHASVSAGGVTRLLRSAPAALAALESDAAVFTYVAPPRLTIPVALAIHDVTFMTNPEWLPVRARVMLRRLVPAAARRAAAVLALSDTARREICDVLELPASRVHVVSPAARSIFQPAADAERRVADRFGLRRYCLAVGDLGPRKNLATLRAAVAGLRDATLTLVVVGRGTPPAGWRDDPSIRLLGHVTDEELADLYAAAAVTVFPSLHEGFGLPALEALACGSPLVVSDRGALPEVVADAALVARPDVAGLGDAIRAALEPTTAGRLRAAGPARAGCYRLQDMGETAWRVLREVGRR